MFSATGTIGAATLTRQLGAWRPDGRRPAYLALAEALRLLVLDGRVSVGTALPSERALAAHLEVSRTTVTAAYAELRDSGHLQSRQGARSVLTLPHTVPAEPADTGSEADLIRLNIAAPSAPDQIVHDGYRHALECAPPYLAGIGLYPGGIRALRESIARRYTDRGLPTAAEQVLVTSGAQHALRIVLDTLVHPGDRVLIEQPTHHGTILAIRRHNARPVAVGLHPAHGWDLDQFEAVVKQQNPRIIFSIADFHNPTGLLLDAAGRARLAEISARYRVPLVVDETMAELGLDVPAPPPLAALAPRGAQIISIGSASKTVWAGLRVGWIRTETPPDGLTSARYDMDLAGAVFEQLAAGYALDHLDDFLPARLESLRLARSVALEGVAEHLPGATVAAGVGGLCLWVTLPRPVGTATAAAAAGLGVRIAAGSAFGVDGALERNIRIPYTLPVGQLSRAIDLVGAAYRHATGGAGATPDLAGQLVV
ncbi:PLP-dependent aminotransferase family protein [Tsukamurella paurometabola]|uniref:Transcriptional regulator, GntR family with aminotransferase domain n=1 Tax=Tsukamurella paurometabola (strain ATCC 8368 / DSM 20162 / CCUG 35730 / CIP 100753 / JCM 10117 / KCTC 9821 / NBRC 16120 / NCIMB 702349 / NCTC 13040) TaxID=521096 RepID=D5UWC9_TSUPD|nr:PLP-dependent aminotransferase family protein [Tsukamurella paurometabola]ADG79928.1 transcriptional regulator, GntR family with aminotransferase domain [Tsukamurella paurometabola DSM 20162]SUP37690.1 Uncharacterized HTH-type transcriptional regulator yjiR [Tsukamurella paurometabola]